MVINPTNQPLDPFSLDTETEYEQLQTQLARSARPIYQPGKKREREHVTCRVPSAYLRVIDEALATRFHPQLKTRSDVICDAVLAWVYELQHDMLPARSKSLAIAKAEIIQEEEEQEEHLLEVYDSVIDDAIRHSNIRKLRTIQQALAAVTHTFNNSTKDRKERFARMVARVTSALGADKEHNK